MTVDAHVTKRCCGQIGGVWVNPETPKPQKLQPTVHPTWDPLVVADL